MSESAMRILDGVARAFLPVGAHSQAAAIQLPYHYLTKLSFLVIPSLEQVETRAPQATLYHEACASILARQTQCEMNPPDDGTVNNSDRDRARWSDNIHTGESTHTPS